MLKDDCAICSHLKEARESLYGISKTIMSFTQHLPKRNQQDFGIHISSMESLDKLVVKLMQQHEAYHENEDSSVASTTRINEKFQFLVGKDKSKPKNKKKKSKKKSKDILDD